MMMPKKREMIGTGGGCNLKHDGSGGLISTDHLATTLTGKQACDRNVFSTYSDLRRIGRSAQRRNRTIELPQK
jgi:hypothetical protein